MRTDTINQSFIATCNFPALGLANHEDIKGEEEDMETPEVDIVINNVVCSFSVRCHLNLKEIALNGSNVEYRSVLEDAWIFYSTLKATFSLGWLSVLHSREFKPIFVPWWVYFSEAWDEMEIIFI